MLFDCAEHPSHTRLASLYTKHHQIVLQVRGGRTMALREADEDYLEQVGRWWGELLPRMAPYLHQRGGPIILVQARVHGTPCRPPVPALASAGGPAFQLAQRTLGIPIIHCLCRVQEDR